MVLLVVVYYDGLNGVFISIVPFVDKTRQTRFSFGNQIPANLIIIHY